MARVRLPARASWLAALLGLWPLPLLAESPPLKSAESTKVAEIKPKPADAKLAEAKPAEAKPAEAKPAEAKPAEAKLAEAKPAEAKARPKPVEAKPKPVEAKPKSAEPRLRSEGSADGAAPGRLPEGAKPSAVATATPPSEPSKTQSSPGSVSAAGAPDPQRGVGTRSVTAPNGSPSTSRGAGGDREPSKPAKPEKSERARRAEPAVSHQKGKPPRKAAPTLPAFAIRRQPDHAARQKIADGLTDEDLRAGKDDPELRSLKAAERVLFPRPLEGLSPGWSWDLPEAVGSAGPEVITQGVPTRLSGEVHRAAALQAPDAAWLKSLTLPNLPIVLDQFVLKYLRFYRDSPSGKAIARVWAKKSGRYSAAIRSELGRAGVPTDLVWLSMIESGHNPTITSPAGAAGLWQFMPDAGRTYGLTVDRWVDERLDPERSTQAAGRYLSDLYRRFGSWDLSLASYNMGYAGLSRSIRKFNSNDFWELVRYEAGIPWETTLYVPKIFALSIVMNNKKAFGLDAVESDPPESFDVVQVGPGVPLAEVARAAGVPENVLDALNPAFLAGRTPPWVPGSVKPSFRVHVPSGKGALCSAVLARVASDDEDLVPYVTKFGDTVEAVANAHGVSEARLRAINHVEPKEVLATGTVLLVPRVAHALVSAPNEEVVVVPPREFAYADRSRLFYRVLPGDTLSRVAQVFGVSGADLGLWNALDEGARLQSGMTLQLFVDKNKRFSARTLSPVETRVLVAGSPEFYDYFEGQNGRKRVVVSARENDTLATLGKRYGMTVGSMERINRRSRADKLHAGEAIVAYVDRGRSVTPHRPDADADTAASGTLLPLEPALEAEAPDLSEPPLGSTMNGSLAPVEHAGSGAP